MTLDDFRNLVARVLVDNSRVKGVQKRIHQPLAFPQPLPGLCSIRADVPGETNTERKPSSPSRPCCRLLRGSSRGHLRHPEVFLKTVVHSALSSLEASPGSFLQPEWGIMISSLSVCSPLLMTTIFRGSCEERFHRVPAGGGEEL